MMTVKELIEILQRHDPDAEVAIAESQYEYCNVLVVMEDPSNPDDCPEIHI